MTSILITGSNGFIGSHLTKRLLDLDIEVSVLNRSLPKMPWIEDQTKVQAFCYDGSSSSIKQALTESDCSLVIHLASYFIPRHQPQDLEPLITSNLLFSTQLLDAMAQVGVKKFVNTGTYWQHYQNKAYAPVSLYAATKQAFEDILIYYVNSKQIDAITLKLFDTYGDGDTRRKVLNLLIEATLNGSFLKLSPGQQRLSLVHVSDVVSAYEVALSLLLNRAGCDHQSYGIGNSEVFSLRDIAKLVEEVTGCSLQAEWGALPYREMEVMEPWSEYEVLPGWQAKVSLKEGLKYLVKAKG